MGKPVIQDVTAKICPICDSENTESLQAVTGIGRRCLNCGTVYGKYAKPEQEGA